MPVYVLSILPYLFYSSITSINYSQCIRVSQAETTNTSKKSIFSASLTQRSNKAWLYVLPESLTMSYFIPTHVKLDRLDLPHALYWLITDKYHLVGTYFVVVLFYYSYMLFRWMTTLEINLMYNNKYTLYKCFEGL